MIVLIDMDEVIADFQGSLEQEWQKKYPDQELFKGGIRRSFYVGADGDQQKTDQVNSIIHAEGFFESLKINEGAKEAIEEMRLLGHTVFILTSPGVSFPFAPSEKYRWVRKHFGTDMLQWLIMTPAKPIVRGDILIDDRPEILFEERADWEHVLYDRSYNEAVADKRRVTWKNWKQVLPELL